jgi:hypothetical protein
MSKRRKGPRRLFRAGPAARERAEPCDICGAPCVADSTSDGYVFRRLEENIAAGRPPFFAYARACSGCRERAAEDPAWGEAIADQVAELATLAPESN